MNEITAKLMDALTMFWQSLDEHERRVLALGAAYLAVVIVAGPIERRHRERQQEELADRVAARLAERVSGRG